MPLADDILSVLNDPTHMWSHALKESSRDSQRLFLTLTLLPLPATVDDLQIAYSGQNVTPAESFIDSLRALEDSFVTIGIGFRSIRRVNFRNPSLQDFSHQHLNDYSDWLDTLLSTPVYYEQIIGAYKLGMSRAPKQHILSRDDSGKPVHRTKEGGRNFENIHKWLTRQHSRLAPIAIDLAVTGPHLYLSFGHDIQDSCSRLKELLEIILVYGMPSGEQASKSLSNLIQYALRPATKSSASIMLELLRASRTADVINAHCSGNAVRLLRDSLLDKDSWKFSLLSSIDEILEVDSNESINDWGDDYFSYAQELPSILGSDADYETIDSAIDELRSISSFLGVDVWDRIDELQVRLDNLPQSDDDGDYEGYSAENSASRGGGDSLRALDGIFSSLLD